MANSMLLKAHLYRFSRFAKYQAKNLGVLYTKP